MRFLASNAGVFSWRVNVKKHAIVYSTGHVGRFGVRVDGEKGGGARLLSLSPPSLSLFSTVTHPLGKNFFLSPPLVLKSKIAIIVLAKKKLSTR